MAGKLRFSTVAWRRRDPLLTVTFSQVPFYARGARPYKFNAYAIREVIVLLLRATRASASLGIAVSQPNLLA